MHSDHVTALPQSSAQSPTTCACPGTEAAQQAAPLYVKKKYIIFRGFGIIPFTALYLTANPYFTNMLVSKDISFTFK